MLAEKETSESFQNLLNFEKFWTKLTAFTTNILIKSSLFIGRAAMAGLRLYSENFTFPRNKVLVVIRDRRNFEI